ARSAYIQMISEKERYGFGCFARTITAKQQPGSKPKLFYSLESSHPTNTHQKSAHHLVSKSPQLSIVMPGTTEYREDMQVQVHSIQRESFTQKFLRSLRKVSRN
ncbi:hypothetical protein LOAG_01032, partial [Loa loa]